MELLWAAPGPLSVGDVQGLLHPERELAYTTVMTVLDRLAKKGLTTRERIDRAWRYTAASTQIVVVTSDLSECLDGVPASVQVAALQALLAELPEPQRAEVLAAPLDAAS